MPLLNGAPSEPLLDVYFPSAATVYSRRSVFRGANSLVSMMAITMSAFRCLPFNGTMQPPPLSLAASKSSSCFVRPLNKYEQTLFRWTGSWHKDTRPSIKDCRRVHFTGPATAANDRMHASKSRCVVASKISFMTCWAAAMAAVLAKP